MRLGWDAEALLVCPSKARAWEDEEDGRAEWVLPDEGRGSGRKGAKGGYVKIIGIVELKDGDGEDLNELGGPFMEGGL